GFSQRRKQVGKLLAGYISDWPRAAELLGLDRQVRAEAIPLEKWIALTNHAKPLAPPAGSVRKEERFAVVNEWDEVTGEAPRVKVHGDNLRHRAVHILISSKN